MLARFRRHFAKLLRLLALPLIKARVSPNAVTASSLVAALAYVVVLVSWGRGAAPLYLGLLALASLLDSLDGVVARALGRASEWGSFLDSFTDRICDAIFTYSLYLLEVAPLHAAVAQMVGAFLVSYARARGESLGVKMEGVGVMERSERLIATFTAVALAHVSLLAAQLVFYALLALTYVTVAQRVTYIRRELTKSS